jgi:hypothetical protein
MDTHQGPRALGVGSEIVLHESLGAARSAASGGVLIFFIGCF